MASEKYKCPVCEAHNVVINDKSAMYKIDCPLCGHYRISSEQMLCEFGIPKHLLSGVLRNTWESTGKEFDVYSYTIDSMESLQKVSPVAIPSGPDVPAKANLILRHLQRKSKYPGEIITLDSDQDYSIGFSHNKREFSFFVGYLLDLKLIENVPDPHGGIRHAYRITPSGWAYLSGIGAEAKEQGFIAMAFRLPTSDVLHTDGLNPGITNAGYNPLRIDRKDHNNRIDDEIVAEIRKSKFVVADLTGKNAGAYFEAGFAMGLGKPVIWTCQQSEIDAGNVHFDTRQYSIVSWEPGQLDDFAKRLTQRIEATVDCGRYVATAK